MAVSIQTDNNSKEPSGALRNVHVIPRELRDNIHEVLCFSASMSAPENATFLVFRKRDEFVIRVHGENITYSVVGSIREDRDGAVLSLESVGTGEEMQQVQSFVSSLSRVVSEVVKRLEKMEDVERSDVLRLMTCICMMEHGLHYLHSGNLRAAYTLLNRAREEILTVRISDPIVFRIKFGSIAILNLLNNIISGGEGSSSDSIKRIIENVIGWKRKLTDLTMSILFKTCGRGSHG